MSFSANLNEIRRIINLSTVSGFVRAYEANLAQGMSKGDAYEATEAEYELYYQRRKYLDRDVFMPALCRHYRQQKKTPATAGRGATTPLVISI